MVRPPKLRKVIIYTISALFLLKPHANNAATHIHMTLLADRAHRQAGLTLHLGSS